MVKVILVPSLLPEAGVIQIKFVDGDVQLTAELGDTVTSYPLG